MTNKIIITMFGEFSITYRDKKLSEKDCRGSKMLLLLEFLVSQRDREVTQNELIDLLWSDSRNPANALKTLVHRTRTILDGIVPNGAELITGSHGSYRFVQRPECVIDSDDFNKCMEQAEDETLSRTKRISVYKKAIALYKGGYLANSAQETWVQPINVYYHALYNSAVDKCVQLLYPMGKFAEIVTLCERATVFDQSDENLHANLIRAFVAMGEYERAAKQYEYIRKYLMEQYGSAPTPHLTELYELTVKPRNGVQDNLDAVIGDLTDEDGSESKGVFYCHYEIFKYIFRLYKRESKRLNAKMSLCLVSVLDSNRNEVGDIKLLEKAMDKLSLSISNSLRMRDVYTRYSRSQYLLLLLEADRGSFKKIEDRIMTKFRRSRTMDNIKIRFDFKELSAAPEAVPPRQN